MGTFFSLTVKFSGQWEPSVWKRIWLVFFILTHSLVAISHASIIISSLLIDVNNCGRYFLVEVMVVSSANIIALAIFKQFLKSFTYIKNNKGAELEPW